ncbi:PIN/TRAM domain-containing protein [Spirochaetota bacterium]
MKKGDLATLLASLGASVLLFALFDLFILKKVRIKSFIIGALLFICLIFLTFLVHLFLQSMKIQLPLYYYITMAILWAYISIYLGITQSDKLAFFLPSKSSSENLLSTKILDTSAIIDGRILDIGETGFVDGPFLIPTYVLKELQLVADSTDHQKRTRGRRGLDVLNQMKQSDNVSIMIDPTDYPDIKGVDPKLLRMAKEMKAKIITTDYNLNKVAKVEGIAVLNINDLSNALKPIFIPGDTFKVHISKEGKERPQGIGYLDDGTMVVVEDGKRYIHQDKVIHVTSIIQNPSGRIIFGKVNIN